MGVIKDGYINMYGFYAEDHIEADVLPCPKCGRTDTCEVVHRYEYDPPGYQLKCSECGYITDELMMEFTYDNAAGISSALCDWNYNSPVTRKLFEEPGNQEPDEMIE